MLNVREGAITCIIGLTLAKRVRFCCYGPYFMNHCCSVHVRKQRVLQLYVNLRNRCLSKTWYIAPK